MSDRPSQPRLSGVCFAALFVGVLAGLVVITAKVSPGHLLINGQTFATAVAGGNFTRFPLVFGVPWAAAVMLGLCDWRRPWQVQTLDVMAMVAMFAASDWLSSGVFFWAMMTFAAAMWWWLVRLTGVWMGWWQAPQLRPTVTGTRLKCAVGVLLFFRVVLGLGSQEILDVGIAAAMGAHRLLAGVPLYHPAVWHPRLLLPVLHGDTYGPVVYYVYLPFVALFGQPPNLLATVLPPFIFDALIIWGLVRLGRRLGGEGTAAALCFAYLLFPFAATPVMSETFDGLIGALAVWTLVALERPAVRGALVALAALTKFLPALVGLAVLTRPDGRRRSVFTAAGVSAAALVYPLLTCGPVMVWQRTFGFQWSRGLTFSYWSYAPAWLADIGRPLLGVAVLCLAASPLWRRRAVGLRDWAALSAGLLVGSQLLLGVWFYTYVAWFFPLLVVAFVHPAAPRRSPEPAAGRLVGEPAGV